MFEGAAWKVRRLNRAGSSRTSGSKRSLQVRSIAMSKHVNGSYVCIHKILKAMLRDRARTGGKCCAASFALKTAARRLESAPGKAAECGE